MSHSLPVTLLLGGPLEGMRWAIDNAAVPVLQFDVPAGGYIRHVARRPVMVDDTVEARVFYVHEDVSKDRARLLTEANWQEGAPMIPDTCEPF